MNTDLLSTHKEVNGQHPLSMPEEFILRLLKILGFTAVIMGFHPKERITELWGMDVGKCHCLWVFSEFWFTPLQNSLINIDIEVGQCHVFVMMVIQICLQHLLCALHYSKSCACINSCSHKRKVLTIIAYFTNEESKAWKGEVTCRKLQGIWTQALWLQSACS